MAGPRFLFITLDCVDPGALAGFWSALLETPIGETMDEGRFVFLEGNEVLPTICFQRVPEESVERWEAIYSGCAADAGHGLAIRRAATEATSGPTPVIYSEMRPKDFLARLRAARASRRRAA